MNRNKLKTYAPEARRDFIRAVTDRASYYGLTAKKTEPVTIQGDVAIISGRAFPKKLADQRKRLEDRIKRQGFEQVMEAMAYTWFNRLVAIRFMELHGYLDHGYRVLSHPEGGATPEIVEHAEHVDLPGLDKERVVCLKLEGTKEAELYRMLLIAQCNALHSAMPFLFERIDDETELLLPDNLLHSDSLIRTLVNEIPEEDWQEVEVIGWLYQFYISEKKDEVIGKVVKSEDIPAATQLFTPNWIVKYLVHNTLGRKWMAAHPNSPLKTQMEYYIEPAEQTPEVEEQLKTITTDSLNPEELTLLDPACGSGHILVEAYDLLKAIYQERGYRAKDIPRLILDKNLYGLEIDDRAAQLAAFAVMMKARADDRRIFDSEAKPHVLSFQESGGIVAAEITHALNTPINQREMPREHLFEEIDEERAPLFSARAMAGKECVSQADIAALLQLFKNAKTFGSLIEIPPKLAARLPEIEVRLDMVLKFGDLTQASAGVLRPLLQQAKLLRMRYSAVVANPPYMGNKFLNPTVKDLLKSHYDGFEKDLFSAFMRRNLGFAQPTGYLGFMSPFVWMFITTFEEMRNHFIDNATVTSLVQLEYSGFEGATVPICTFTLFASHVASYRGTFIKLSKFRGAEQQAPKTLEAVQNKNCGWRYEAKPDDFKSIPGSPVAYWVSSAFRKAFVEGTPLIQIAEPRQGMATADNNRFLRLWHEVSVERIAFGCSDRETALRSGKKWVPYNKGGDFRKWFGNNEYVVNWEHDGREIRSFTDESGRLRSRPQSLDYFFRPCVTWTFVSSAYFGVRRSDPGFAFDVGGSSAFPQTNMLNVVTGFLCCSLAFHFMKCLNPTLNFQVGNVAALPFWKERVNPIRRQVDAIVEEAVAIARRDWDQNETSWAFEVSPYVRPSSPEEPIEAGFANSEKEQRAARRRLKELEEENNRLFIDAYGLEKDISPDVPEDEITLYSPNREEEVQRFVSYAIGCVMGRYSLDRPGLIYAHSGGKGFDPTQYQKFPADEDGIVPLTESEWFEDDAANRLEKFIATAWPKEHLEENLKFIAESLGPNRGERPRETIRRYLATGFYKHHLSMYKKRPIYWLFSSGKQRAFQCLVYLHRYNAGTLSRMRTEYVIPLSGKMASRIDQLEGDIAAASSTSHRKKLEKERQTLVKQREELQAFDELLRHYADQRVTLDLDDGVKVNYGKFGNLLAEVKAVTGGASDD